MLGKLKFNNKIQLSNSNISLQDTLDIFFQDEHLDDFKCETCQTIEQVTIRRKFAKLPRILILHLKRYQFQESDSEFKLVKNDSSLKIPQYLKLNSLTTAETKSIRPVSIIKKAAQKLVKRPILRSINSKMNITPGFKIPKMVKDLEDELPDIAFTDRFKDYRLNNLTEEQQLEQALAESKNDLLASIESVVDTMKSKVDSETVNSNSLLYLDGTSYTEEFQEEDLNL